jgi:hypothetical protein
MVIDTDVPLEHKQLLTDIMSKTPQVVLKGRSGPATIATLLDALAVPECLIARLTLPKLTPREESMSMPVLYNNKSLRDVTVHDMFMLYACASSCTTVERLSFFYGHEHESDADVCWDVILQMPSLRTIEFRPTGAVPLAMFCIAWPGCTVSVGQWGRLQISRTMPPPTPAV